MLTAFDDNQAVVGERFDHRQAAVGDYFPALDGLRAVAIILVLLFHADPLGPFSGGFIGVDIFFVLSAYLITGILARDVEKHGRIRLGHFYVRRALRLVPALALMLSAYLVAAPVIWPALNHGRDALIAALYLTDYSFPIWGVPHYLRHTWSLAIEEHFYLVWPLILPLLLRSRRPMLWLAILFAVVTIWRAAWAGDWIHAYYRFDTHLTGLVAGAILYFMLPHLKLRPWHAVAAFFAIAAVALQAKITIAAAFIPVTEIAAFVLVGCLVTGRAGPIGAWLSTRPMVAIGRLSYAIYLWNSPFAYAVRDDWGYLPTLAATAAFSLAAALVSYYTVEAVGRHIKARSDRLQCSGVC